MREGMTAAQVVAGLDALDGGPAYSVPRLAAALQSCGVQQTVHAVGQGTPASDLAIQLFAQD